MNGFSLFGFDLGRSILIKYFFDKFGFVLGILVLVACLQLGFCGLGVMFVWVNTMKNMFSKL